MSIRYSRAALIALALAAAPLPALADCQMFKLAELPVTMSGMQPLMPAKINGADALFMADSGAFYSSISPAAAAQYRLKLHRAPEGLRVEAVGGSVAVSAATVEELTLANQTIKRIEFMVGGSEISSNAIGVLGQNLLGMADAEYDLANGVIRLMRPGDGCRKALLAYWVTSQPYSEMDLDWRGERTGQTMGVAYVNDIRIRVVFDTGASTSFLARHAAERAGFKADGAGVVPAGLSYGFGRRSVRTWIANFPSFKVGDEEIHNARLRVGDSDLGDVDMLLGADFFLSHHIYVANSRDKLYFTYNGGPVFNLAQLPSKEAATDPSAAIPPESDGQAGDPTDAAGYARRGAAYAARRDFEHAIADLTRANELDPKEASYLSRRGVARWNNDEATLALADFDEALKLKPDDIDALLWRVRVRLGNHDIAGATTDLAALDRVAPKQANVRLEIADDYVRTDMLEVALVQFDLWIAAHPDDANLPDAKNGRCWVRALLGTDLDKALKDCNDALRMIKSAEFLDSRGLVLLRLGDYDKAMVDYDASLNLKPGDAWSLYGRGIGRLRKGMAAQGQADIDAAKAITPSIAEEAKRHGLVP
jgi:tetratricopeptide (TPR) repeat protein/predicted aspartyl protease